jgi:hypothetical protein
MGRKPLAGEVKKSDVLRIRLTGDERRLLDRAAEDEGTSTWARSVLLRVAKKATGRDRSGRSLRE